MIFEERFIKNFQKICGVELIVEGTLYNKKIVNNVTNKLGDDSDETVQQNGYAIRYIKNPSEEVKKLAVQQNGQAIRFIKDPSEEVKKLAVQQKGITIHYIDNPSEEVQRLHKKLWGNE